MVMKPGVRHPRPWLRATAAAILLSAVLLPAAAQAFSPLDAARLFGTEHGDGFTSIFLNQIFGPIFPSAAGGTSTTVFSTIIGYFNIIMLVVGGLLFFYNATVGLLQSAHEGQVLGQRWSSLWAPLRILFAVGLLVPMPNLGGYNLAQAGIAYIVKGSTNIASAVWTASADLVVTGRVPITTNPPSIPPDTLRILYQNAACESLVTHHMALAAGSSGAPHRISHHDIPREGDRITRMSHLAVNGNPGNRIHPNICGSFTTPNIPEFILNVADDRNNIRGISESARTTLASAFTNSHLSIMGAAAVDLRALTDSMLPTILDEARDIPDISGPIASIMTATNDRISTFVDNIMQLAVGADRTSQDARNALLSRIRGNCIASGTADEDAMVCYGEGWIGAGSWYMMVAQLNAEIASLTQAHSTADGGAYITGAASHWERENSGLRGGGWGRIWGSERSGAEIPDPTNMQHQMDRYMLAFDRSAAGLAVFGFEVNREHLRTLAPGGMDGSLMKIPGLERFVQGIRDWAINFFSPGSGNFGADPMMGLSGLGLSLIGLAGILGTAAFAGGFLSGGASAIMLMPLFVTLITAGITLAMILPIIPFVLWVLAVTGYFILVVEAMIAVALWAIAHMRMDGEGISGEAGRNGWLMILSLLMTPVLMVFGFLIGMTIFRVTSALLDIGIFQAIYGFLGGGIFLSILSMTALGIFLAIFYMILLERSFSLVSEFPGRVLRWMGAGAQLTSGEEGRVRLAAGAAGVTVARGAGAVTVPPLNQAGIRLRGMTSRNDRITGPKSSG